MDNPIASEVDDGRITFVCIGHHDHGKSTICGHLLDLVGYFSTIQEVQ